LISEENDTEKQSDEEQVKEKDVEGKKRIFS
jgi:hypothetical protein